MTSDDMRDEIAAVDELQPESIQYETLKALWEIGAQLADIAEILERDK